MERRQNLRLEAELPNKIGELRLEDIIAACTAFTSKTYTVSLQKQKQR